MKNRTDKKFELLGWRLINKFIPNSRDIKSVNWVINKTINLTGRKSIIDLLRVNKSYLKNNGKIINETIWIPMIGEEKLDENVLNWMKFNVDFREHFSNSNDMVLLISEINGQIFVGVRITAKIWGLISNWRNHNTEPRVKKYLGGWVNELD